MSAEAVYSGPKEKLHIYLLIGQSNMAGRAAFSEQDAGPLENCYLLDAKDSWEIAQNPLNRYSTIRKGLGMQKMNPGYTFAKTLLEKQSGISIGLVVNAKGGNENRAMGKGNAVLQRCAPSGKSSAEDWSLERHSLAPGGEQQWQL